MERMKEYTNFSLVYRYEHGRRLISVISPQPTPIIRHIFTAQLSLPNRRRISRKPACDYAFKVITGASIVLPSLMFLCHLFVFLTVQIGLQQRFERS